ncbi:DUF6213 family protein [Streptomyces tritici]|uniref:DUF6213 family protein n=1 Tax=Streptomyces tritici TaxID=2054410 RepID=UPI003AF15674
MTSPGAPMHLADGHLLLRADQMTGLLRHVAAVWLQATDTGEADFDPETVLSLATGLMEIADQIDVECIALMPLRSENGEDVESGEADEVGKDAAGGEGPADGTHD